MEANSTPVLSATPNGDRDENGRFRKGHAVKSPGRPARQRERAYLEVIIGECPLETWRLIVARAVEDAIQGDRFARDWLSKFLLPTPPTAVELHIADGEPRDLTDEELAEIVERHARLDADDAGDNDN